MHSGAPSISGFQRLRQAGDDDSRANRSDFAFRGNKKPRESGVQCKARYLLLAIDYNIGGVEPFWPFCDLEGDTLALRQGPKTFRLYGGVVHKNIITTPLRLNKTKPLGFIKPLNDTLAHR